MKNLWIISIFMMFPTASVLAYDGIGGGDCVLTNQAELHGTSITASLNHESANAARLDFAPQSIFLARGAAIKLFTQPNFQGNGSFLTDDFWNAHPSNDGVYINLKDIGLSSAIASFSCVGGGIASPKDFRFSNVRFFNDKIFTLEGYRGNHPDNTLVTVTYKDGKKRITAIHTTTDEVTTTFIMDLDNAAITVSYQGRGVAWMRTIAPAPDGSPEQKLMYAGAASKMSDTVTIVYHNKTNSGGDLDKIVPNLELEPVISAINALNTL